MSAFMKLCRTANEKFRIYSVILPFGIQKYAAANVSLILDYKYS